MYNCGLIPKYLINGIKLNIMQKSKSFLNSSMKVGEKLNLYECHIYTGYLVSQVYNQMMALNFGILLQEPKTHGHDRILNSTFDLKIQISDAYTICLYIKAVWFF
ncbi:hypothetical protein BpHYR1_044809 [Brachionus plicatilis]|uniref:Uncharacterized protein n=1 Tax=Brachionus plicatilis TaxID=10195 RepID=A0A3M7QGN1_BRAPC|nr:hypothetical protein BpHYR1_044809 [Brachionus plicatilis]